VYVQKHSLSRRTITRHSVNKGANIVKQTISLLITIISIKHPIQIKPRLLSEQSCIQQSHYFRILSTDSKDNEMCQFAEHIKHVTDRKVPLSGFFEWSNFRISSTVLRVRKTLSNQAQRYI